MAIPISSLRRGPRIKPPRVVLMGTQGVGKSTWANSAPNAVFVPTEDGLDAINVNAAFPQATSVAEVCDNLDTLIKETHDFQTVAIDSADWLEILIHNEIATAGGKPSISDIGYGKGYGEASNTWLRILGQLETLRNEKGMIVIILAHTKIKTFNDPTSDSYDRYILDLHDSSSSVLREWCDVLGFANHSFAVKTSETGFNKKVTRATGSGERLLYVEERPGFVAKNRYGLPPSIPFPKVNGWQAFEAAFTAAQPQGV